MHALATAGALESALPQADTLRFICLATLLLQPNLPSIILLDEPERGGNSRMTRLGSSVTAIATGVNPAHSVTMFLIAAYANFTEATGQFDAQMNRQTWWEAR